MGITTHSVSEADVKSVILLSLLDFLISDYDFKGRQIEFHERLHVYLVKSVYSSLGSN